MKIIILFFSLMHHSFDDISSSSIIQTQIIHNMYFIYIMHIICILELLT